MSKKLRYYLIFSLLIVFIWSTSLLLASFGYDEHHIVMMNRPESETNMNLNLINKCSKANINDKSVQETVNKQSLHWKHMRKSWDLRGILVAEKVVQLAHALWKTRKQYAKTFTLNVADFGCGIMTLKPMVSSIINSDIFKSMDIKFQYIPIDAFYRNNDTIICNFNNHEFPFEILRERMSATAINIAVCQGCFEYIYDKLLFLKLLNKLNIPTILTYSYFSYFDALFVTQLREEKEMKYLLKQSNYDILENIMYEKGAKSVCKMYCIIPSDHFSDEIKIQYNDSYIDFNNTAFF